MPLCHVPVVQGVFYNQQDDFKINTIKSDKHTPQCGNSWGTPYWHIFIVLYECSVHSPVRKGVSVYVTLPVL